MSDVEVEIEPGTRLFARDLGSGSPVVLVAGFGMTHDLWDRQVRVLSRDHRVICVDQRGHGRSDKPLHGYGVEQLATDLVAVLRHLDVVAATVVGHSFGGQVAFRVAATEPELVARLVLVGSNAVRASRSEAFPFGREPVTTLQAQVDAESSDRVAARRAGLACFAHEPEQGVRDWLLRCSLDMPSWAAIACFESMLMSDLLADLPAVTVPVLQVVGADDPVQSTTGAEWLRQRLTDARILTLADCGHFPMLEAPDALDAALLSFAGGGEPAGLVTGPVAAR